jgi:hypothetical protein
MITTTLTALAAREHVNDLREHAARWRRQNEGFAGPTAAAVELRLARAGDTPAVHRLADLDDAQDLEGQVLLAVVDGEAVAALSLADRRVVANPFVGTQDAVTLLRMRADHLMGVRARRRRRWIPRVRFA